MSFKIKALCVRCTFRKNDFTIFHWSPIVNMKIFPEELKISRNGYFSTKGNDGYIDEGKEYELELEVISNDSQWGSTCKILSVPSILKQDISKLSREEKFNILMSCTSSERIANNILDAYPDYIEKILNEGKESIDLKKIKGVGEAYHNAYSRQIFDKYKYFNIFNKFSNWSIDMVDARKISGKYGSESDIEKAFEKDPYDVLIDVCDKAFLSVDKTILEQAPQFKESETRCAHLMLEVLDKNEMESGSTRLKGNDLYYYIRDNLNYPELLPLIKPTAENSNIIYYDEASKDLAKMSTYLGECRIAQFIKEKLANNHVLDIDWTKYTKMDNGMELSDEQANALKMFCENDFMLLTGNSGSGKTSSLKAILDLCDDNDISYVLFSFTGAASLRVTEATGRLASTIHRPYFQEREFNEDLIVVDEFSMVDVEVFNMLISMIANPEARVLLVGDDAQLQSVGCGNLFNDIINSGVVPNNRLEKIFRYDSSGGLFVATNVRKGIDFFDDPMVKHIGNEYTVCDNYKFIETDNIFDNVVNEYNKLLSNKVKPKDILCLSPYNVQSEGTYVLNNTIQNIVNPIKPNQDYLLRKIGQTEIHFRIGDKVINKKNDYKALPLESYMEIKESGGILSAEDVEHSTVFNGQVGYIRELNDKYCVIQFDEELLVFDKTKMAHDVLLGYCITDHASQGSESDYVISVVSESHSRMHTRNLLYVADTRAKKKHIDIGSVEAFKRGIAIDGNQLRETFLKELLLEGLDN